MCSNSTPKVEQENHHAFPLRVEGIMVFNVNIPVVSGALGSVAEVHIVREGTFPQCYNLPFFRLNLRALFRLEEVELLDVTLFPAVRLLEQVASGWVTLAGSRTALQRGNLLKTSKPLH
jgi:hypothetical protein